MVPSVPVPLLSRQCAAVTTASVSWSAMSPVTSRSVVFPIIVWVGIAETSRAAGLVIRLRPAQGLLITLAPGANERLPTAGRRAVLPHALRSLRGDPASGYLAPVLACRPARVLLPVGDQTGHPDASKNPRTPRHDPGSPQGEAGVSRRPRRSGPVGGCG